MLKFPFLHLTLCMNFLTIRNWTKVRSPPPTHTHLKQMTMYTGLYIQYCKFRTSLQTYMNNKNLSKTFIYHGDDTYEQEMGWGGGIYSEWASEYPPPPCRLVPGIINSTAYFSRSNLEIINT